MSLLPRKKVDYAVLYKIINGIAAMVASSVAVPEDTSAKSLAERMSKLLFLTD